MEHLAPSNASSSYEGFKNPLSRSISEPVGLEQRYPSSRNTETDSLSIPNTLIYGSTVRYPPSKSSQSVNEFNTNISPNPINTRAYPETPTFLDESNSNMCFEPESMDSYLTETDFNPILSEWPPSNNSGHDAGSALDTYPNNHGSWQGFMAQWPGTSAEYPAGKACATLFFPS
jgi:hypothetical protein